MSNKYPSIPSIKGQVPAVIKPVLQAIRMTLNVMTGQVGNNRVATLADLSAQNSAIQAIISGLTPAEIHFLEDWHNKTLSEWYQYQGTATYTFPLTGEVGGNVLNSNGYTWQVHRKLIPYNAAWTYHVSAKIRRTVAATDPAAEKVYVGVTGVAADGTTLINVNGTDSFTSQHYAAADGYDMNAHAIGEWVSFSGWFSGYGTFTGGSTATNPTPLTAGIAYIRPTFILNYNGGDGAMEIDYIAIAAGIGGRDGVDGADGTDGADAVGTEYIFAKYNASTLPASKRPSDTWGFESPGTADLLTWFDGAPDLDATDPYLYRAQRQIIGFPANGSTVTDTWSLPVVVGYFGVNGVPGANGNDGVDANGLEYIFAKYTAPTLPGASYPSDTWGYDNPGIANGVTWFDGAPDLDATDQYLFMAQRVIQGAPAFNDPITELWTVPTVISRYGVDGVPGVDGADGVDGIGTEFIFTRYSSSTLPGASYPDNAWGYDNPGTINDQVWSDGAPDLTVGEPYLFRSRRMVQGIPAFNDPVTDNWSTPVVVGALGLDGVDGADAVGTEYVFAKYTASTLPAAKRPSDSWGYDSPGVSDSLTWFDDAPGLDATDQFLFRAQRQIVGFPSVGSAVTDLWTLPVVVGRYAVDGLPGADGSDGVDADGLEHIFAKHSSSTLPGASNPSDAWGYDNPGVANGVTWLDAAPDLDATDQYLFTAQRPIQGSPAFNDAVAGVWSTPSVVARYGVDGLPGADGADGSDGVGTEYIFTKYSSETLPGASNPSNAWGYDNPGTINGQVWTDGAPNLDATDRFLYRSQRKVIGVPAFNDPVTDAWTTPAIVGHFGADGLGADPIMNSTTDPLTGISHTSEGNAIKVDYFYYRILNGTTAGPASPVVELRRNGTIIHSVNMQKWKELEQPQFYEAWGGSSTVDIPGTGTFTYTVTVSPTWTNGWSDHNGYITTREDR